MADRPSAAEKLAAKRAFEERVTALEKRGLPAGDAFRQAARDDADLYRRAMGRPAPASHVTSDEAHLTPEFDGLECEVRRAALQQAEAEERIARLEIAKFGGIL